MLISEINISQAPAFYLEETLELLLECIFASDPQEVKDYVEKMQMSHPLINKRAIAQKIVDEQAINSSLLGAATGLGSLITLPVTIPLDIIKAWRIHDFTIRCIAYIYGYKPHNTDLRNAIIFLISNGSIEELKNLVLEEATRAVNQYGFNTIDSCKRSAIHIAAKECPKHAAKAITKYGEKALVNCGMEIYKYLAEALCKIGGKKIVEKALQSSLLIVAPLIGAIIGGSVDWMTTQTVGKLAIEYFENSGPELLNSIFNPA